MPFHFQIASFNFTFSLTLSRVRISFRGASRDERSLVLRTNVPRVFFSFRDARRGEKNSNFIGIAPDHANLAIIPRLVTEGGAKREPCQISPRSYTEFIVAINSNVAGRRGRRRREGTNVHPSSHRESWIRKGGEVRARNSRGRQETESARARARVCVYAYLHGPVRRMYI